ncbi:MAG: hypothetical protein ACRYHQ_23930 [Janthinobacterium lividum]
MQNNGTLVSGTTVMLTGKKPVSFAFVGLGGSAALLLSQRPVGRRGTMQALVRP